MQAVQSAQSAHDNVEVRAYVDDACIIADEPYFLPVIAELQQQPLPAGYLDYLRLKVQRLSSDSRLAVQKSTLLDER